MPIGMSLSVLVVDDIGAAAVVVRNLPGHIGAVIGMDLRHPALK